MMEKYSVMRTVYLKAHTWDRRLDVKWDCSMA